jgi:hypothetical protein
VRGSRPRGPGPSCGWRRHLLGDPEPVPVEGRSATPSAAPIRGTVEGTLFGFVSSGLPALKVNGHVERRGSGGIESRETRRSFRTAGSPSVPFPFFALGRPEHHAAGTPPPTQQVIREHPFAGPIDATRRRWNRGTSGYGRTALGPRFAQPIVEPACDRLEVHAPDGTVLQREVGAARRAKDGAVGLDLPRGQGRDGAARGARHLVHAKTLVIRNSGGRHALVPAAEIIAVLLRPLTAPVGERPTSASTAPMATATTPATTCTASMTRNSVPASGTSRPRIRTVGPLTS